MIIHDRWAEIPAYGLDNDTNYRDIDTLERLLQALGSGSEILEVLRKHKKTLLVQLATETGYSHHSPQKDTADPFSPGTVVRLKVNPAVTDTVLNRPMQG